MDMDGNGQWFSCLYDFECEYFAIKMMKHVPYVVFGTLFVGPMGVPPPGTKLAKSKPAESA
jgi:hypothetical protein